jgi:hypothetical protein
VPCDCEGLTGDNFVIKALLGAKEMWFTSLINVEKAEVVVPQYAFIIDDWLLFQNYFYLFLVMICDLYVAFHACNDSTRWARKAAWRSTECCENAVISDEAMSGK